MTEINPNDDVVREPTPPVDEAPIDDVVIDPPSVDEPVVEVPTVEPTPPVVDTTPIPDPPRVIEERARAEAWSAALEVAETETKRIQNEWSTADAAAIEADKIKIEDIQRRIADGEDVPEGDLYLAQASNPAPNLRDILYRKAMEMVTQYVLIDTPTGTALRVSDNLTIAVDDIGQWIEVNANDVEHLRGLASQGHCTLIVRPPGWKPKAVTA